jgi:hypothetical protein
MVLNGSFSPHTLAGGLNTEIGVKTIQIKEEKTHLSSTSLIYAEKTLAFISALPAASRTLLGCQSTESTVERIGFFSGLETHQSLSGSKEQIEIMLPSPKSNQHHLWQCKIQTHRAPLATANLFSRGLHLTKVAALLILSRTRVGFHIILPDWGSGVCCQT